MNVDIYTIGTSTVYILTHIASPKTGVFSKARNEAVVWLTADCCGVQRNWELIKTQ